MKVLIVGGTGIIGKALVKAFKKLDQEVIIAGNTSGDVQVELSSSSSIDAMYQKIGPVDAVISASGRGMPFKPASEMSKDDYIQGIQSKLLGQIDLVLRGMKHVNPKGSFTLTSGILNHSYIPKGSCAAMVNCAIEGFAKSAALEMPHQQRLNIISPDLVVEAKHKYGEYFVGFSGTPLEVVTQAYVRAVFGIINGQVLQIW